MMQNMMQNGMQKMMDHGAGGWLMMGSHVAAFAVVILAGAALVKYLFFSHKTSS